MSNYNFKSSYAKQVDLETDEWMCQQYNVLLLRYLGQNSLKITIEIICFSVTCLC